MKKVMILSLSLFLTSMLVAGAVFAQGFDISIGGHYEVGADIISGNDKNDGNVDTKVTQSQARLNLTAQNDSGTFGGFLRVQAWLGRDPDYLDGAGYAEAYQGYLKDLELYNHSTGGSSLFDDEPGPPNPADYVVSPQEKHLADLMLAWAWWQPIKYLKLQAGILDDFYVNEIVDTFGGNAEEVGVHHPGFSNDLLIGAFGQEFSATGVAVSGYPIEGLALNLGIPYFRGNTEDDPVAQVYSYMQGQAQYTIGNVGRASLAFRGAKVMANFTNDFDRALFWENSGGGTGDLQAGADAAVQVAGSKGSNHAIYAAFYFTMIENMSINFGLKVSPPYTEIKKREMLLGMAGSGYQLLIEYSGTYNSPMLIGLGFNWQPGAFGIAARLGISFMESWDFETTVRGEDDPSSYGTHPIHQAGLDELKVKSTVKGPTLTAIQVLPSFDFGVCKVYLNAGLDVAVPSNGETKVGFYVNPYVSKVIGGGSVFAGVKAWSDPGVSLNQSDVSAATKGDGSIQWSIPVGIKVAF